MRVQMDSRVRFRKYKLRIIRVVAFDPSKGLRKHIILAPKRSVVAHLNLYAQYTNLRGSRTHTYNNQGVPNSVLSALRPEGNVWRGSDQFDTHAEYTPPIVV
eukprot:COSAG01_NODE_5522_length_4206_cov_6.215973_4_plen_102_part_00